MTQAHQRNDFLLCSRHRDGKRPGPKRGKSVAFVRCQFHRAQKELLRREQPGETFESDG